VPYTKLLFAILKPEQRELIQDEAEEDNVDAAGQKQDSPARELGKKDKVSDSKDDPRQHQGQAGREEDLVGVCHAYYTKNEHDKSKAVAEWSEFAFGMGRPSTGSNGNKAHVIACGNKAQCTRGRERVPIRIDVHELGGYVVPKSAEA
jgi:hypothetical protein